MAKIPQTEADQRLKVFFRDALLSEPGMSGEKAEQLAERCVQSIDTVLTKRGIGASLSTETVEASLPARFDPFAFSAVSVLARKGKDALLARLNDITTAENLREFAIAQHIAIDQTLTKTEDLRIAIVKGTERRIAARRAAAS
ncbi:MAG: hypothetical protein ABL894_03095 [Hyphomicrobium sp.]